MQLSAELSLYPLDANYEKIVLAFIDTIVAEGTVSSVTNTMSTQIQGDCAAVLAVIEKALTRSYMQFGKQVLVAKLIPEHQVSIDADGQA